MRDALSTQWHQMEYGNYPQFSFYILIFTHKRESLLDPQQTEATLVWLNLGQTCSLLYSSVCFRSGKEGRTLAGQGPPCPRTEVIQGFLCCRIILNCQIYLVDHDQILIIKVLQEACIAITLSMTQGLIVCYSCPRTSFLFSQQTTGPLDWKHMHSSIQLSPSRKRLGSVSVQPH